MIKNFPFCDYYKKHRDASSFDLASYYSAVSSNGTYINRQITQPYNKTKYFLIDFSRSTQYYFHLKKMAYYYNDALIFQLYNQDKKLLVEFNQTAQQYDYSVNVYFYLKITNSNIQLYSKNETTNVTLRSCNVELTNTDKFYMVVYPNIQKMTITPATIHFVDNSKTFNVLYWENRQQNMFARKYRSLSSCGLKAIYPKDGLLFYFDFQDNEYQYLYDKSQTYREYVAQNIPAKIGDYNLHVVSSSDGYTPAYPYLIRTTGFKNQGAQFYGSAMPKKSNFDFQYNFQQFTLCSYIKRTSSQPHDAYDLLTYGYGAVYDYSNSDANNKNKGFGFYIREEKLGVRFNANSFLTDYDLKIGSWSFICLTYDKQYLRCYVNGVQIFEQKITQTLELATKFYVGTSMDCYENKYYNNDRYRYYNCVIDQLACFSKCLNSFYIKTIYDSKAAL